MSTDQFEKNYRDAQERIERLRNQIDDIANARPGQSVASQKYLMKATWATLQTDLSNFDQLMYYYQNEPHKYPGVSKKEITRRINLINDIKDLIQGQLTQEYKSVESNQAAMAAAADQAYSRGEDGEYDQTRDLDNKQVLQHQKDMLKDQDN